MQFRFLEGRRIGPGAGLSITSVGVAFAYLIAMVFMWSRGIAGIRHSFFIFYANLEPVSSSIVTPVIACATVLAFCGLVANQLFRPARYFYIPALACILVGVAAFARQWQLNGTFAAALEELSPMPAYLGTCALFFGTLIVSIWWGEKSDPLEIDQDPRARRRLLIALAVFAFVFPLSVALLRDGFSGITSAYSRARLEYISDIGSGDSIRGLFQNYLQLLPDLSLHAKVHPPGPIALLWLFSYGVGTSPLALSIATVGFGALAIFPMYLWVKEMFTARVALIATMLYTLVPSIVLFSATSVDITFMPFTLTTLYLFQRAMNHSSKPLALAAGIVYGLVSFLHFSLLAIGFYFGVVGLMKLADRATRRTVVQTAVLMLTGVAVVHGAVWLWSGYETVGVFQSCYETFAAGQARYDEKIPAMRMSATAWKLLNVGVWFFFAGIPISLLFVKRLVKTDTESKKVVYTCVAMLVLLNLLYMARGEGERSAMYLMPFIVIPAAHLLDKMCSSERSAVPLVVTSVFLAVQSWAIESLLYTRW